MSYIEKKFFKEGQNETSNQIDIFKNKSTGDLMFRDPLGEEILITPQGGLAPIINNLPTGPTYKVYTALLTQSGTDAPVATVLENTLGYNITWGYSNVGVYTAIGLPNTFEDDKFAFIQGAGNSSSLASLWAYNIAGPPNNTLILECYDLGNVGSGSFDLKDDILINQFIEIRVYN